MDILELSTSIFMRMNHKRSEKCMILIFYNCECDRECGNIVKNLLLYSIWERSSAVNPHFKESVSVQAILTIRCGYIR